VRGRVVIFGHCHKGLLTGYSSCRGVPRGQATPLAKGFQGDRLCPLLEEPEPALLLTLLALLLAALALLLLLALLALLLLLLAATVLAGGLAALVVTTGVGAGHSLYIVHRKKLGEALVNLLGVVG